MIAFTANFAWELYLVTESDLSPGRSTIEVVKRAIEGGVKVIQMREKFMDVRERYQLGKQLRRITAENDVCLIINDRVDLALALNADGVHLGQEDFPWEEAREILGENSIIGASVSEPEQLDRLNEEVVDYIGFGSVFTTQSKRLESENQAVGIENLKRTAKMTDLPILGIGGINNDNVKEVIKAGAEGAAVISALTQAENIAETAERMITKIKEAKNDKQR